MEKDGLFPEELIAKLASEREQRVRDEGLQDQWELGFGQKRGRALNARLKDLIFVTPSGLPIRAKASGGVLAQFREIQYRHELPSMTFHDLRHVAASILLAATDGNLFEVSRILGHADTRMLQRTYGHLLGHGRGATDALDRLIEGARTPSVVPQKKASRARNRAPGGVSRGTKGRK